MAIKIALVSYLLLAACASEPAVSTSTDPPDDAPTPAESPARSATTRPSAEDRVAGCANIVNVVVRAQGGSYAFDVTVSSTETGWDKYADAWEIRLSDGTVLGVRELAHPHETEQPFTRSLSGVEIPQGVTRVTLAARDSVLGYCGDTMTVDIPGSS